MKNSKKVISLCGIVLLFQALPTHAALLVGTKDASRHFEPLSPKDPIAKLAYHEMVKYQWPTQEEQNQILRQTKHSIRPILEEEILELDIKQECQKKGLKCHHFSVLWIPPTLWDFAILVSNLSKDTRKMKCGAEPMDISESEKNERALFECLQNEVLLTLEQSRCSIHDPNSHPHFFQKCTQNLILEMARRAQEIVDHHRSGQLMLAKRMLYKFSEDIQQARVESSDILGRFITEEILAHEKNQVIVWRATRGIAGDRLLGWTLPNPKASPPPTIPHLSSKCLKEGPDLARRWLPALENESFIDFPIEFAETIQFKSLSFSNSPLAGFLYDGENTRSACTFSYLRPDRGDPTNYLFRITLDRENYNARTGAQTISPGELAPWFGVFGIGERFHAHTLFFNDGDERSDTTNSAKRKAEPTEDQVLIKGFTLSKLLSSERTQVVYATDHRSGKHLSIPNDKLEELNIRLKKSQLGLHHWFEDFLKCRSTH